MGSEEFLSVLEDLRKENNEADAKLLWHARLASDLELFAISYFPHYCIHPFNEFHHDTFDNISFMERAVRRSNAAPRGYAKSTITALIKPLHDVCYALEDFIVMVSNTDDQADQKLRDIRAEILTNMDLVNDYGIHFKTKKPGTQSFIAYCRDHACMFKSVGAGKEIRGIRFGAKRPSKIVCDDTEHSDEVLNEALRTKYEDWYYQVISQIGNENTNIDFIGTILHRESLLSRLLVNPAYTGKVYKAVITWADNTKLWAEWQKIYTNLDDNSRVEKSQAFYEQHQEALLKGSKVLWPEKEPYLFLMKELIEKGKRAFMKEKQNEPLGSDEALLDKIHYYQERKEGIYIEDTQTLIPWVEFKDRDGRFKSAYGALDPATGQTKPKVGKKSDTACLVTGLKDWKGRCFVHEDWTKRASPTKQIAEIFEHNELYNYEKVVVEINLYRNLLQPNILDEQKRQKEKLKKEVKIPFYEFEAVENKEKRIYTIEPKVTHGWILFNRTLSQEFMNQLLAFPRGDHDDAPDALEMLWSLMHNRFKPMALDVNPMAGR
jgi:predicted phage terminase large subunit-like protein